MNSTQDQSKAWRGVLYIEDNKANCALVEELISRRENSTLLSAGTGHLDGS